MCYHQLSGSGTISLSMIGHTISHYRIVAKLGEVGMECGPPIDVEKFHYHHRPPEALLRVVSES